LAFLLAATLLGAFRDWRLPARSPGARIGAG
jgi:hypothetical protein